MTSPGHRYARDARVCAREGCETDLDELKKPPTARYCSDRCRATVAWARQGVPIEVVDYLPYDPCTYCGGQDFWRAVVGIDHIVPRSAGGEDAWTNLIACCRDCNSGKRDKPLLIFLLGRYR